MKLKLFFELYGVFIIIGFNTMACIKNIYLIPILLLFYFLFIKEYNRVGFVNRKMIFLIIFYLLSLIVILGWYSYLVYLSGILLFIIIKVYIPYRFKIREILTKIDINKSMDIYYDHIEQNENNIAYSFDISQSEVDWLTKQILFRSKELKHAQIIYTDNEIIGNNFHVNIT